MKHNNEQLLEFLFGDMTEDAREAVRRRVETDPAWKSEYENLMRLKGIFNDDRRRVVETEVPYGYWERFNSRLFDRISPPQVSGGTWRRRWSWTVPALAMAGLLYFFLTAVPTTSERIDFVLQTEEWLNSDTVAEALTSYIQSSDLSTQVQDDAVEDSYDAWTTSEMSMEDVSLDVMGDLEQLTIQEQKDLLAKLEQEDII